jgi:lysyl endopeptidase
MKKTFTLLLLLGTLAGVAQVTNERNPISWKQQGLPNVAAIDMPGFDLEAVKKEDAINDVGKNKPWRFGYEFLVDHNLSNAGNWTTLSNGDRIWRIRYTSAGAKTMNFLFSDFYLPKGATVYLYNNSHTDVLGAYDARQNNPEHVLGTWLVKGSDIWIEYYEPAAVAGQGRLEIFKVVHGYRTQDDMLAKSPDDDLNGSGNCNYDVDCYIEEIEEFKDINKKAVGLIIVSNSGFCSGGLVNNTANDGTPYFLTANHCAEGSVAQWAFRFNWISPNPVCASNTPSTNNAPDYYQTVSGAVLRAKRADSDFCLVEITANIPAEWDLVYAGWDRSSTAPESVFGIHHPAGDIMKTCLDYGPLTTETYMWRIEDWDMGVTEGGSSGSPLYDNNGRLRGQLYGGNSGCVGTNDNNDYDAYGRFDVSWNGTMASTRLKDWLDPNNTGQTTLDYYPPQELYAIDARSSITATGLDECVGTLTPQVRITNKGSETLTSATITYQLNDGTIATYNWTGSLTTSQADVIDLPQLTAQNGNNTFTVTVTQPNNTTDENPADNTSSEEFAVRIYDVQEVTLTLVTDSYGEETSWELANEDGDIVQSGGSYGADEEDTQTFDLTAGCYTFTIYDEYGDGMCCTYGNGSYELTLADGTVIASGGSFGSEEATGFSLLEEMGTANNALQRAVSVYPNPSNGVYNVTITNGMAPQYTVYSILGQELAAGKITANGTINLGSAANGIYLLKLQDKATGAIAAFKLIKE